MSAAFSHENTADLWYNVRDMKNTLTILPALAALVALAGCETMYGGNASSQSRRNQREQQAIREQMERQQVQQDAAAAAAAAQSAELRLSQLEMRIERIEATLRGGSWASQSDVAALRRETESLRAEMAGARGEHEQIRSEIVSNVQGLLREQQSRAAAAAAAAAAQRPKQPSGYEHIVESGQTLSAIAQAYGVSVQKIKQANKLSGDTIRVGQKLFIPD